MKQFRGHSLEEFNILILFIATGLYVIVSLLHIFWIITIDRFWMWLIIGLLSWLAAHVLLFVVMFSYHGSAFFYQDIHNVWDTRKVRILKQKGGGNLRHAKLRKANLRRVDLSEVDLEGADLSGSDLRCANLSQARLWNANLSGADLIASNLNGADLRGADLSGVRLWNANLRGACLIASNLNGSDLSRANLKNAILSEAKNLTDEQLAGAILDENTILPDGSRYMPQEDER
jgi:hypothetical protein